MVVIQDSPTPSFLYAPWMWTEWWVMEIMWSSVILFMYGLIMFGILYIVNPKWTVAFLAAMWFFLVNILVGFWTIGSVVMLFIYNIISFIAIFFWKKCWNKLLPE